MSDVVRMMDARGEVPRANPLHVEWLNEGVQSWNRRRNDEPFKPELTRCEFGTKEDDKSTLGAVPPVRHIDLSHVNLSGADLRRSIFQNGSFRHANFVGANLDRSVGIRTDFSRADFRGAQFRRFLVSSSNFRKTKFGDRDITDADEPYPTFLESDFSGAGFYFSDFADADFSDSKLSGVSFRESDLSKANLVSADLTGVKLDGLKLWRARLFAGSSLEDAEPSANAPEVHRVHSLRDLVDLRTYLFDSYEKDIERGQVGFYFRGDPCSRSSLRPTVMRRRLRRFEGDLLTGLKTEFPSAFSGCEYAIDELAIARHYGLPTRLLDVSRNPLVATYWATGKSEGEHRGFGCEAIECTRTCSCVHPAESCEGKLHVFAIPTDLVCAYDSDRVSIVANFARLPIAQQERLLTKRQEDVDGDVRAAWGIPRNRMDESLTTLIHNIQREKSYFTPQIDIRDLFRVFVVEPRRSFERVRSQSGAFLLSAFHERLEGSEVAQALEGTELYDHRVIRIPAGLKSEIRGELDWVSINAQTLKADVESAADAVARRFRAVADRLDSESVDGERP